MLQTLCIRNIVLIDKLDLSFENGLGIFTGETGAGKSILMDALSLALGARSDNGLIRKGEEKASVSASFSIPSGHNIITILDQHGIELADGMIILRRVLSLDGKSQAYLNDQPISVGFLRTIGDYLVEIHGQNDDRGLLDAKSHRALLDKFGGYQGALDLVKTKYQVWREKKQALESLKASMEAANNERDYLTFAVEELNTLAVEVGEEGRLADQRQLMMKGEKTAEDLDKVMENLGGEGGIDAALRAVLRQLERASKHLGEHLNPIIESFDRAAIEFEEGFSKLNDLRQSLEFDEETLNSTEERLFALRAAGRKYKCMVDELPSVCLSYQSALEQLDQSDEALSKIERELSESEKEFSAAVMTLRQLREKAASELSLAVLKELPPLKLEKAKFEANLIPLDKEQWGEAGGDRIEFLVSTNVGTHLGPLIKIASGGELSRFILALKVVLSRSSEATTMIFDEVDRGIGGATADAVGERLFKLAKTNQILVVTHSPQVAARGQQHFRITKSDKKTENGTTTFTNVENLTQDDRHEEIARMLAGASITDEARAAAAKLIQVGQ